MSRAAAKKRAEDFEQTREHPWDAQVSRKKREAERRELRKLLRAVAKLVVAVAAFYFFFGW